MKINLQKQQRPLKPVSIAEWDPEAKAFLKPLDIMDRISFNDLFLQYHDREEDKVKRAEAGLSICVLCLVGEDGEPLFTLDDLDELKNAPFEPIARVVNSVIESGVQPGKNP